MVTKDISCASGELLLYPDVRTDKGILQPERMNKATVWPCTGQQKLGYGGPWRVQEFYNVGDIRKDYAFFALDDQAPQQRREKGEEANEADNTIHSVESLQHSSLALYGRGALLSTPCASKVCQSGVTSVKMVAVRLCQSVLRPTQLS